MNKVKVLFDNFMDIPFPKKPKDDTFYEYVTDYILLDSHYMGIVDSILSGRDILLEDISDLLIAKKNIEKLIITDEYDKQIYKEMILYMDKLYEIVSRCKELQGKGLDI